MGLSSDRMLTVVGVVSTIVLLSSLSYEFLLHDEEEVAFTIDDSGMMEDVSSIASFGPRVAGSVEESLASDYISQRFTEIGLENVKVEEFQVTGAWFVDAEPEDHQILMHAQLEQGVQNAPGLPDGSAGTGRIAIDETGELNHVESFTFMGYSGSTHKHDNMLTFIGNGSAENFDNIGEIGAFFSLIFILFFFSYLIYSYVATWRSATKYTINAKKKKKGASWAYAAKVVVVLSALNGLAEIVRNLS